MRYRITPLIVALVAAAGLSVVSLPTASADVQADCGAPAGLYKVEALQDNTPDCLHPQFRGYYQASASIRLRNDCEEAVDFETLDCESCQESVTVAPDASNQLRLIGSEPSTEMEDGDSQTQTYAWTMGSDREGILETEVTYEDPEPVSCDDTPSGGCAGALPGDDPWDNGPETLSLLFVLAAGGWRRSRG